MKTKENKKYKIKIMDDERIIINMHSFNPFKNRVPFCGQKRTKNYSDYMSRKEYQKTVKRWCAKLWEYRIESGKCRFITLTLKENMHWNDLLEKFKNFLEVVYRQFGKTEYIRGIEVQEESKKFHIHFILIFKDEPPQITESWLEKYWKYGKSHIDNEINVYDVYGLIEYLTLFKKGSCREECFNSTYFPQGARFLSTSYNIPKADIREKEIEEEDYNNLMSYAYSSRKNIREDGHYYPSLSGASAYCLDREYVRDIKEYVINNWGTKEDELLLAEIKKTEDV